MDKLNITPTDGGLFGFLDLFGFLSVRFFGLVRVSECSVCSVDFVEKLWESLRETLWEIRGKVSTVLHKSEFYTSRGRILHNSTLCGGKFSGWFCTSFYLCKMQSFAHFPHSLLLQLLNN